MSTHTPGPWKISDKRANGTKAYVEGAAGYVVAQSYCSPSAKITYNDLWAEAEANARLIAAAPDLLESSEVLLIAWQKLAAALPQDDRIEAVEFEEFANLRSAVAKARGIQSWEIHQHLFPAKAKATASLSLDPDREGRE